MPMVMKAKTNTDSLESSGG